MAAPDPRLHPYRADVAAEKLRGKVDARAFAVPNRKIVAVPVLDLFSSPDRKAGLASQLICGEAFDVYSIHHDLAWGQSVADEYVGYVALSGLGRAEVRPVRVTAQIAHVYPEPSIKTLPRASLPFWSSISTLDESDAFVRCAAGYVSKGHLDALGTKDFVAVAERFLGAPYLWGGRTPFGLDCSALVQLAFQAMGHACPRDSDMQAGSTGVALDDMSDIRRGDLVFWDGHVGIMQSEDLFLHANAFHMKVTSEPLAQVITRIRKLEGKDVLVVKRPHGV